jgi:hypothetical protein
MKEGRKERKEGWKGGARERGSQGRREGGRKEEEKRNKRKLKQSQWDFIVEIENVILKHLWSLKDLKQQSHS